jgi:hypothetical protein
MAYRHRQHERSADPSSRDSLSEQPGTKQFHIGLLPCVSLESSVVVAARVTLRHIGL